VSDSDRKNTEFKGNNPGTRNPFDRDLTAPQASKKWAANRDITNLDWDELLAHLEKLATASPTRAFIAELKPKEKVHEAEESFARIDESRALLKTGIRPHMESLDLFNTWHLKLKKHSTLGTLEIRDVRHFCTEVIALKEILRNYQSPWLNRLFEQLMKADEPLSAIDNIFTLGGEIRSDASETLYNLFREKESLTKQIQQTLDRLVRDYDMEIHLQDKYVTSREGRWVIPVKGGSQHHVKGIIQSQSQSKQTVFIEPEEVIPLNSRLKQVEWGIEQEIERLLTELSQYLSTRAGEFLLAREILQEVDLFLAMGTLAEHLNATTPIFSQSHICLRDLRHPLLVLNSESVVPNSLTLDQGKHILLLTGPNAGGKTVLLKALGLAAQMARCGLPIAASTGSELPFFEKLVTAIGDSQSVDEHLSTFAAHLKILDRATQLRNEQNLLLVDEVCGSTDPEEGSALGRSFIETYAKNKIFAVITSHLGPLKIGWGPDSEVLQGSLQYDEKSGRPTYLFIPGVAGSSLALQTAKRVGVSMALIDRAYELLTPEQRAQRQAFDELDKLKQDLISTQKDFNKRAHEAEKEKKKYETLVQQFEKEKAQVLDRLARETQREIQEHISHAKADETFKKFKKLETIKHDLPEIIRNKKSDTPDQASITSADEFSQRYPPGSKVYIPSLSQDGIVQGQPNAKGDIPVLSNSLRLSVSWRELKPPEHSVNPTANVLRYQTAFTTSLATHDPSIDIRGLTVEKALEKVENELDQALLRGEDRVKIIHGHGTEALKRSLRAYLSRSPYVKKWKAGTPETGGDGITWVEIETNGH
jgi:DNA mismatch repair protein MutS2